MASRDDSSAVRSASLGEGSRIERAWRVISAHLGFGEVPIEALDLDPFVDPGITDDAAVDRAADDSFPASDPPSFTASHV
jgi:hypothetical protein